MEDSAQNLLAYNRLQLTPICHTCAVSPDAANTRAKKPTLDYSFPHQTKHDQLTTKGKTPSAARLTDRTNRYCPGCRPPQSKTPTTGRPAKRDRSEPRQHQRMLEMRKSHNRVLPDSYKTGHSSIQIHQPILHHHTAPNSRTRGHAAFPEPSTTTKFHF